jgi:hypothetical protein
LPTSQVNATRSRTRRIGDRELTRTIVRPNKFEDVKEAVDDAPNAIMTAERTQKSATDGCSSVVESYRIRTGKLLRD